MLNVKKKLLYGHFITNINKFLSAKTYSTTIVKSPCLKNLLPWSLCGSILSKKLTNPSTNKKVFKQKANILSFTRKFL